MDDELMKEFDAFMARRDEERRGRAALPFRELLGLADKELVSEVDARVALKAATMAGLASAVERNISAIGVLRAEVQNGGFEQFFFNRSADIETTLDALDAVGVVSLRSAFVSALSKYPEWVAWLRARLKTDHVDGLGCYEKLHAGGPKAWDQECDEVLARYIRQHADALDLPPRPKNAVVAPWAAKG